MSYKIMSTNGTLKLLWNYICSDHLHLLSEKAISDIFSRLSSAVSFLIMQQNKWHKEQYTLNGFMISNIEVFVDPTYSSPVPVCFFYSADSTVNQYHTVFLSWEVHLFFTSNAILYGLMILRV